MWIWEGCKKAKTFSLLNNLKNWQRKLDWIGTWTRDLWITVPALFHLSYFSNSLKVPSQFSLVCLIHIYICSFIHSFIHSHYFQTDFYFFLLSGTSIWPQKNDENNEEKVKENEMKVALDSDKSKYLSKLPFLFYILTLWQHTRPQTHAPVQCGPSKTQQKLNENKLKDFSSVVK
jgi:hypothetical protein